MNESLRGSQIGSAKGEPDDRFLCDRHRRDIGSNDIGSQSRPEGEAA